MYDSSPGAIAKLELELRQRAAFVVHVFLRRGVSPRLINADGHARYALPEFWGWNLRELQTWEEEVEKPTHRLERGDIYRRIESTHENHYLSADGFLLFGSYCLNVCFRSGLHDDIGTKGESKFGVATSAEIGYLDFSITSPRYNSFRRGRERIESWSVERKRTPDVEIWGLGLSRRIDALAATLVDAATLSSLCPNSLAR